MMRPMAFQRPSLVHSAALRSKVFSLVTAFSIGLRSRTVGKQVQDLGFPGLDRFPDTGNLMARQIIENEDVAGGECRRQNLLDIGSEEVAVDRAVEHVRSGDAGRSQTGDQGGRLPMAVRNRREQAQAAGAAAQAAGHVGGRPGLVKKNQAFRIEGRLATDEDTPLLNHIIPLLLGGVQAFF